MATHTLNIAQAWAGLAPNPDAGLAGPPGIADISIGLPMVDEGSPILVAQEQGYFEDAGFESVEVIDVEQPLLGLLNGELDFGIVDMVDASDGASQGLPAATIAGHRNYTGDGVFGGDVVLVTVDMLESDSTTATAFLIAYIQALQDLAADPAAAPYAPFDGGFGSADVAGGVGEMRAYLADALGAEPDLDVSVKPRTLHFAQAWWGLPANPAKAAPPAGASPGEGSEPSPEEAS